MTKEKQLRQLLLNFEQEESGCRCGADKDADGAAVTENRQRTGQAYKKTCEDLREDEE